MLVRFEHSCWLVLCCAAWLVVCCEICAADFSPEGGTGYRWVARHSPLLYGEPEFSFAAGPPKRLLKRLPKLRTAGGFGRKRALDATKIKKLQVGMLRTAIGFGKRAMEYRTPETDQPLLLKIGPPPKENYLLEWNYEDAPENDKDELLKIIRKFQELKHRTNAEDVSSQTEEPEQPYSHFNRFTLNNYLNLEDEQ